MSARILIAEDEVMIRMDLSEMLAGEGYEVAPQETEPGLWRAIVPAEEIGLWRFEDGELLGVMGIQDVQDVTLVRHAYVATHARRGGIGGKLLQHLLALTERPLLVGTWRAATWAVDFYARHGFRLVDEAEKSALLRKYWSISERQNETSVVLRYALTA